MTEPKPIDGPVLDKGETEIRESFDALLDFFGKLGYLLDIKVISKKEIRYFLYFIKKATEEEKTDGPVIRYAKLYDFQLFAVLLDELGSLPDSLSPLRDDYYKQINQTNSSIKRKFERKSNETSVASS